MIRIFGKNSVATVQVTDLGLKFSANDKPLVEIEVELASAVVLLGDSTIDNIFWITDKSESVGGYVRRIGPYETVHNAAMEAILIAGVLENNWPFSPNYPQYQGYHSDRAQYDPIPSSIIVNNNLTRPINAVTQDVDVVLSLGGNDWTMNMTEFLADPFAMSLQMVASQVNLISQIRARMSNNRRIYIVIPYMVSSTITTGWAGNVWDMTTLESMQALAQHVWTNLIPQISQYGPIAVIDMLTSTDHTDPTWYAPNQQLEPGPRYGELFANLLTYTYNNFMDNYIYSWNAETNSFEIRTFANGIVVV